jgi:dTDP-4-dehydrorhamnose reductase
MRVLLTGGSGLLGSACRLAFEKAGFTLIAPTHAQVDLTQDSAVEPLLNEARADLILNCAAQRRPDLCESERPEVRALNCDLPERLARRGTPLIHISTDYVFNGTQAPYEVDAPRRPLNAYGRQKAEAEARIEGFAHVAILRLPILYGPTDNWSASAVTCLAANLLAGQGAPVKIDDIALRYPTLTTDIAQQLLMLAPHIGHGLHGCFHYTGEEAMTKHLMALHMAPIFGYDPVSCLPDHTPPRVPRPYDCHLSVKRLQQLGLYCAPTPFRVALRALTR